MNSVIQSITKYSLENKFFFDDLNNHTCLEEKQEVYIKVIAPLGVSVNKPENHRLSRYSAAIEKRNIVG